MENNKPISIRLLTRADIVALGITYSNTTLLELEKIQAFPQRVRLSGQRVGWVESEIKEWLQSKIIERNGGSNE